MPAIETSTGKESLCPFIRAWAKQMVRELPEEFLRRMKALLGAEYEDFLASYEKPAQKGIRLNLTKFASLYSSRTQVDFEAFVKAWHLQPLPEHTETAGRCREFVLDTAWLEAQGIRAGKHPYHEAGLYYLQEPSAMQAVAGLQIKPHDRVLDLCAAPGGKSTQAADMLDIEAGGFIFSNEYVPKRAQILSANFERMGIANGIVSNEDTGVLAARFPEYFTKIIVDAPCSGEGMFRKDETAVREWSPENVALCAARQQEILENAVRMLAAGGMLSYSTCTFERCENEEQVERLLAAHAELSLVSMKRLWPHRDAGEGHFLAVFKKAGTHEPSFAKGFREQHFGDRLYRVPSAFPDIKGLKVLRCGLNLGTELKGRFEPSHASTHARRTWGADVLDLSLEDPRTEQYLRGMQLCGGEGLKGFVTVTVDGAALGLGKAVNGQIKNHYPKGLRWL